MVNNIACPGVEMFNFLLTQLVDFESWKMILTRSEKNSGSIGNNGPACLLPNSLEKRHLDVQGNIHSFGILLLEIISGKPPYCKDKGCLIDWVNNHNQFAFFTLFYEISCH